jgi:hypothetical protein
VGHGGAAGALNRGWEAAEAAVDDEPRLRRGSGEVESLGKRKTVEMHVCEHKSESVGSSRTCSRSRRSHGCVGAAAGKPAVRVAAQAGAARRGAARRGPARGGERWRGCWGGTWHRGEWRGAAGARHMASRRRRGSGAEKTEKGGSWR